MNVHGRKERTCQPHSKKLIETAKKYYGILEKSNISVFSAFGDQPSKVGVFDDLLAHYSTETEDDDSDVDSFIRYQCVAHG